jgi:YD repeat-containing protein
MKRERNATYFLNGRPQHFRVMTRSADEGQSYAYAYNEANQLIAMTFSGLTLDIAEWGQVLKS